MRTRRVVVDIVAKADLRRIRSWIADQGAPMTGRRYFSKLNDYLRTLATASERGTRREDIEPGLRIIGYGSTVFAIKIYDDRVVVTRAFHGGQDWERVLRGDAEAGD